MPLISSIFLTLSLVLAVVFGSQMRPWSWGPALLALTAALACASVALIRGKNPPLERTTLALGLLTTAWFAWVAVSSPVPAFAHADLLLLAATLGAFLISRTIATNARAHATFMWALAILVLASATFVFLQHHDAAWSQFRQRPATFPSGFYPHYNDGANFLLGGSFLLLGASVFANRSRSSSLVWLLAAVIGLTAVYFTRSRGAILAAAIGFTAFTVIALVVGSKQRAKWLPIAMIGFPIVALTAAIACFALWQYTHDLRFGNGSDNLMDANTRLRNYSLAIESIFLHPWTGGGSRSFSWNSLLVWDHPHHGHIHALPEQVHNEILQAATDYGIIGAAAILILLAYLGIRATWHARFDEAPKSSHNTPAPADALRVGGIAAIAAMLVQSSFSFVFHLLPGAMLLGIAMGCLAAPPSRQSQRIPASNIILATIALAIAFLIARPAITASRVHSILADIHLNIGTTPNANQQISRLNKAIEIHHEPELFQQRAILHHQTAIDESLPNDHDTVRLAINDYVAASTLNPKHPGHAVNAANLLSSIGDDAQAELFYNHATLHQGNAEPAFHAHFHLSDHLVRKASRLTHQGNRPAAIETLERAAIEIESAAAKSISFPGVATRLRVIIHSSLGALYDANGDAVRADQKFNLALRLPARDYALFTIGQSLMRRGYAQWHARQPDIAFRTLSQARDLLARSDRHLPHGVDNSSLRQDLNDIDQTLSLLRTAGFGK